MMKRTQRQLETIWSKASLSDQIMSSSPAKHSRCRPPEADIEDILDPAVYEALVREAYAKELKGKALELNTHIPRIARRFEAAFDALSISFHKTRPTRLFLQKMATNPSSVLPTGSERQFERLCKTINAALEKHLAR